MAIETQIPRFKHYELDSVYQAKLAAGQVVETDLSFVEETGKIHTMGGTYGGRADATLSETSTNAIQNKAVTAELAKKGTYSKPTNGIPKTDLEVAVRVSLEKADSSVQSVKVNGVIKSPSNGVVDLGTVITEHQDISGKADKASLASVATSGNYNDLSNKPTIPAAVTDSTVGDWGYTKNAGTVTGVKVNGVTKNPSNGVVDLGEMLTEDKLGDFVKDDEILELLEDIYAYGIKFYSTTDSYGRIVPNFSKIGNATLLANKPIHKKMRGCVLNNNGQVVRYLPEDSWSDEGFREDEQVMVEVPQHYRRFFYTYDGHYGVLISERPLRGFHLVPKFYVGAYLGCKNKRNELVSNNYSRSVFLANRSDCRNYARTNRDNRWNIMTYEIFKSLWWLYAIDEPNTFIGGVWGRPTRYPNEYFEDHSWGDPSYDLWGCNEVTDNFGNTTGERSYETEVTHWVEDDYGEGDYVTETVSVTVFRWRGIENFLSTFLEWIDGINIKVNPQGGDNTSQVYVCYDPSRFIDNSYDGYNYVGDLLRETEASFDKFIFGENGEPLPANDSYVGDTRWDGYDMCNLTKVDNTTSELRGLSFNGYLSSVHKPSESPNCVTARLCFIPNE